MTIGIAEEQSAASSKIGIAGQHYPGWLNVVRTMSGGLDSYRTDSLVDFDGGWVELQRFAWSRPLESIWHTGERCYFLSLALDGARDTSRRNVALAAKMPGGGRRVLLVPPGQTISSTCPAGGEKRSMRCLIDADLVESICAGRVRPDERGQLAAVDFSGGIIEWLLFRMYREINHAQIGTIVAVESIAREIAVEIARALERQRAVGRRRGGLAPWRMRLLLDRIHADGARPTIGELARMSGMTARHLGRAFQAETGGSIGRFIASAMAKRAGEMLNAGMPVSTVAARFGYASSSSFAHAFTQQTGILPSRMRTL